MEIKEELLKEIRLEELATKQDLRTTKHDLQTEIEKIRVEIEKSKSSVIVWLCGFIVAWTGVLSAILFHFSK